MKQEDKQLLLKDLCARLPYGVKYCIVLDDGTYGSGGILYDDFVEGYAEIEDFHAIRLYLRPMSSMTEEEKKELSRYSSEAYWDSCEKKVDWLNERHFDYRGLIERGLALEAPEGMYK